MVVDPVIEERKYKNIYVCMKCKTKIKSTPTKVKARKAKCRKCGYKNLRAKKKGPTKMKK